MTEQDFIAVPLEGEDLWEFLQANSRQDYQSALAVLSRVYAAKQQQAAGRITRDANSSGPQARHGLDQGLALLVELYQLLGLIQHFQPLVRDTS